MSLVQHQEKRLDPRSRTAAPIQRAADRAKAGLSPRYGFAQNSPRYGFAPASPRYGLGEAPRQPAAPRANGLPEPLKTNMEAMSGLALDDVRVHRNSSEPAALGALAFTQGAEIHLGAGQERHLPHEAWHVVQQKQGRVQATRQLKSGVALNDHPGLEREADIMGARASSIRVGGRLPARAPVRSGPVFQYKPSVANPEGKLLDVATAAAGDLAAVLNGFWDAGKKGKITEAVSVAAVQRPDLMKAVSEEVAEDMVDRVLAKPKLLVEVIGDLWKQGGQAVKEALPLELAKAAAADESVRAQLKALGGHRLVNAVEGAKIGDAKAKELSKSALAIAKENIEGLTFDNALTDEFKKKHVAEGKNVAEATEEAHDFREKARAKRVAKAKKTAKALRRADQAVSTRFLFPAEEQAMIVDELKGLNERILARREANPRALYRLTKNLYSFVSVYKERGQETGKARFWYTVIGTPGDYQINHLDALMLD